jgi:hypothetical protein
LVFICGLGAAGVSALKCLEERRGEGEGDGDERIFFVVGLVCSFFFVGEDSLVDCFLPLDDDDDCANNSWGEISTASFLSSTSLSIDFRFLLVKAGAAADSSFLVVLLVVVAALDDLALFFCVDNDDDEDDDFVEAAAAALAAAAVAAGFFLAAGFLPKKFRMSILDPSLSYCCFPIDDPMGWITILLW